jgi:acyl-CoA thioesterase I
MSITNQRDLLRRALRPRQFRKHGRPPGARTLVVATGDSITDGRISANFVDMVANRLGGAGYAFVNSGVSGDLAFNVDQRLQDDVIAFDPDVVTVLVGTNDVAAHISDEWMRGYLKSKKPTQRPSLGWYRQVVERIVDRLQQSTHARILLIEIPIMGEQPDSVENARVREYNLALHEIARSTNVEVVPLFQPLLDGLPPGPAPAFDGTKRLMGRAAVGRFLLHRTFDAIAARANLTLLTDHIHLSERAAAILATQIETTLASPRHHETERTVQ